MNSLKIQKQNNHLRIFISGELAYQTFWSFESRMKKEIKPFTRVEIDLSDVDFIDSSGIGFILRIKNAAERKGGTFFIAAPSLKVMRILKKLLLNTVFPIIEDETYSGAWDAIEARTMKCAVNAPHFLNAALQPVA